MRVEHIEGKVRVYRSVGYVEYDSPVEAMISEAKLFVSYKQPRAGLYPVQMSYEVGICTHALSSVHKRTRGMPVAWILRLHVWSGMPLSDLEALSGVETKVRPHRGSK